MILMRETSPNISWRGTVVESNTTPSTRKRTRMSPARGSKWMSEAPRRTASAMIEWTSLTTGASSADSRSSMTCAASSSVSSWISWTDSSSVESPRNQRLDVLVRRNRAPDVVAGRHRDVVEREQVGRVGGRHEQRALAEERDRDGLVAPRLGGVDERGGALVDVEDVQVDVVKPVALCEGLGELLGVDEPRVDQALAERHPACPALLHDALDHAALGEPKLHDHVPDSPHGARPRCRRCESGHGERPCRGSLGFHTSQISAAGERG